MSKPASLKKVPSPASTKPQPAAERRAAETQLRGLVDKFSPAHERLIAATRRWLRRRLPAAHEVVYEYRDCFVVSFSPTEHGYEGVFAIRGDPTGVRFYFNRVKGLPDPGKLLQGSGSQARWVQLEGAATLARPEIVSLVEEALARNQVPFATTGRGPVVIRSTSAKPSRRRSA